MKIFKRTIASLIAAVCIFAVNTPGINAEWRAEGNRWWYAQDGSYATGWQAIGDAWYHFDSKGYMDTGWFQDNDGTWYYLYDNGMMAHDCYVENYYLDSNGKLSTNTSSSGISYGGTVDNKSQTAYLSATGTKYHSIPNCGKMNPDKATKTTVEEAEKKGYKPCSKCW